jgi:O-antigen ligase
MRIDAISRGGPSIIVSAGAVASALMALAIATCSIVFSEPAAADALMLGAIIAIPVLGAAAWGRHAAAGLTGWVVVVATGLFASGWSATPGSAITHQIVTLFLALGAFTIAGFVAKDPIPRARLVLVAYAVSCIVAAVAAFIGYFRLLPGAFELFTNFGRARGTFKDPNVLGAALVMGLALGTWEVFRAKPGRIVPAAALSLICALTILISFSRGAWFAAAVACGLVVWFCAATSRRATDVRRLTTASIAGCLALALALGAASQIEAVHTLLSERANIDQSYDQGPEGRFGGQAKARALIIDHPFGIGTHTFRERHHHEEPHNVYLTTFLNSGWLGGLAYIGLVLATAAVGIKGCMRNGYLQMAYVVTTATFVALSLEGFVIDTDHWRHMFIPMGLIWGLADAEHRAATRATRKASP